MLYPVNNIVNKFKLIFLVFAFFTITGCDKVNSSGGNNTEVPCPDNAKCYMMPDGSIIINYNYLVPLNEVVATIPSGYGIQRATSLELNKYSYETAFTEITVDEGFILDEYQRARNKFIEDHLSIENNQYEGHLTEGLESYAEAERILVDDLTTILDSTPTSELKIKSVLAGRI